MVKRFIIVLLWCILISFVMLMLLVSFSLYFGQAINDYTTIKALSDHYKSIDNDNKFNLDDGLINYSVMSPQDFNEYININYVYTTNELNCKYYSLLWAYYLSYHSEFTYNFITTPNHVFVMFYNESGYCIADGNDLMCMMDKF